MAEPIIDGRVTVITVAYNSMRVLGAMLSSVPKGNAIVILDNASSDIAALRQLADDTGASLIESTVNEGFGVACNKGAAASSSEFLLFLNPDAILTPETIGNLVAAADKYTNATGFNPRIIGDAGKPFFKRKSHLLPRREWMPRGWPSADCEVSVLSGAAMFVRKKDFDALGGFDPNIFLFHEDDDLALRLREIGPLMFVRDAIVRHIGGSSSIRSAEVAALKAWHMGHSRVYAARKHKMRFARSWALLEASLQVLSPAMVISKRKRAKQVAFLLGVINAILSYKSYKRLSE